MTTVTLEEAQAQLAALVANLKPGQEILITYESRPVARLVSEAKGAAKRRHPGNFKGKLEIVSEDEEHLKDFNEYI